MSEANTPQQRAVLHICMESAPVVDPVAKRLTSDLCPVEHCGDVYAGLARLGRRDRATPAAVVVCVDGLGRSEMEFFRLVATMRARVSVYVYGSPRYAANVDDALSCGADGVLDDGILRSLANRRYGAELGDSAPVVGRGRQAMAEPAANLDEPRVTPSIARPSDEEPDVADEFDQPEPAAPSADGSTDESEANSDSQARVPWRRYARTPQRTPPAKPPAKPAQKQEGARAPDRVKPHAPLLTEDELDALFCDDVSAIAPDDSEEDGES